MGDLYNGSESESESLRSMEKEWKKNRWENAENRWKKLQRRERDFFFHSMHHKD